MPTANEILLDAAIDHSIDLHRYGSGVVQRMLALLNRVDKDLFEQITAALQRLPAESFTVERLDLLLADVRRLNKAAYEQLHSELQTELLGLVDTEATYQASLLKSVVPVQVAVASVSIEQVYAASLSRPMQGRLLREWASSIEADKMTRIRDALRMGFVEGETIQQMVNRIRGTKARGYDDGIIEIDRRNAASVVRTATAHTANFTRQRMYEENVSLIKGWMFVATLDSRVTVTCASLSGKVFPIGQGPTPPRHWGCRSTSTPVLKSWKDLGIDLEEMPPGTRSSMDGQVAADITFSNWLRGKDDKVQNDILGATRAKLFRANKIEVDRFTDKKGNVLTLDDLRKKHAAMFEKAGL